MKTERLTWFNVSGRDRPSLTIITSDTRSMKFRAPQNISEERCVELLGETYVPRHCAQPGQRWWDWADEEEI